MGIACSYELSPDALTAICHHRFPSCLFPSLKFLNPSHFFGMKLAPIMSMLFGPEVETAAIYPCPKPDLDRLEEQQELHALRCLPEKCPRLLELTLLGSEVSSPCAEIIAGIISQLKTIRVLRIPAISMTMSSLRALSNLSTLEQLTFYAQPGSELCGPFPTTRDDADKEASFPMLTRLSITLDAAQHATQLLAYVTSSRLSSLKVAFRQIPTPKQLEDFFRALLCHPSRRVLSDLIVGTYSEDFSPADESSESQHGVTLHNLLPLLDLPLSSLVLTGFLVDVDDDDLTKMAQAWPELNYIALGVYGRHPWMSPYRPRATLFGLIPIFQHCPRVETIGYRMKTDIFDSDAAYDVIGFSRPGKGVVTDNAVELSVGDSWIHQPVKVASFLSDVCPRLLDIHTALLRDMYLEPEELAEAGVFDEGDMYRKWRLVMDYVPEFVLIRQQERYYIRDH